MGAHRRGRAAPRPPCLLAHRCLRAERTNASTTGLLDVHSHEWSTELLDVLGIPADRLGPLASPGTVLGPLRSEMATRLGADRGLVVTTVGSHDTASAVAAVPAVDERFAYVSSGTWSLMGVELKESVLSRAARQANFTNELGVGDRVRFLRNTGGLWLLTESLRTWKAHGLNADLTDLLDQAVQIPAGTWVIDVEDPAFLSPGDMPARIAVGRRRDRSEATPRSPRDRSLRGGFPGSGVRRRHPPGGRTECHRRRRPARCGRRIAQPPPVPGHGGRCGPPGGRRPGRGDSTRQRSGPGTGSWGSRKLAQRRQNDDLHEHGVPEVPTAMILCQNLKPTWLTTRPRSSVTAQSAWAAPLSKTWHSKGTVGCRTTVLRTMTLLGASGLAERDRSPAEPVSVGE